MSDILPDTMGLMHIMAQLFMAPDIGIDHGMPLIIIQGRLPMVLGFIIIPGPVGDIVWASAMAGSLSGGILTIGAGGVPADTDMDIDMVTVMDIVMAIMQGEEQDIGQDIVRGREIPDKVMCTETGLMV